MSRFFDRNANSGSGDWIDFSPGGAAPLDGGPMTYVVVWKAGNDGISSQHGLVNATNGVGRVFAHNPYTDHTSYWTIGSGFQQIDGWSENIWRVSAVTKPDGNATLRTHQYDYSGGSAGTWFHTARSSMSDASGASAPPITNIRVGQFGSADRLYGWIAAMALFNRVLTDLELETVQTGMDAILDLGPVWAVQFNQKYTFSSVPDISGNGGNQVNILGTSISADEPAGWSYSTKEHLFITQQPTSANGNDGSTYTLGTEFYVTVSGTVDGIRWWTPNQGEIGRVCGLFQRVDENTGILLASKPFVTTIDNTWNYTAFDVPVEVVPGQKYVAAMFVPAKYTYLNAGLQVGIVNGRHLRADADNVIGNGDRNGRFIAGVGSLTWPNTGFNGTTYLVDVQFTPYNVGLATETDTAFSVKASKSLTVGEPIEVDTAFSVGRIGGGGKGATIGLAMEYDYAAFLKARIPNVTADAAVPSLTVDLKRPASDITVDLKVPQLTVTIFE